MNIFNVLEIIGGLCLLLFGMKLMGDALKHCAGNRLHTLLKRLTMNRIAGFLSGLSVTAIIQSSSATTVMLVGFVDAGLMTLSQAMSVIMGANVGTTVTAWILSLGAIDSNNPFVLLLKPVNFAPILSLIGIIYCMFFKNEKKTNTGMVLVGFSILIYGMEIMSRAVVGLKDIPTFQELFLLFSNPVLGILMGAILTGIIQSSSASVGILQALSATGRVTIGTAIPIIMGQNIGTCVTALISSAGTSVNARRASVVHLVFNIAGTVICLLLFILADRCLSLSILNNPANQFNIAICHSMFNVISTLILFPYGNLLEKTAIRLVPED